MRTNSTTTEIQTKTSHSQQRRKKNFIARVFAAGKPFEVAKKYSKVKPMGGRVLIKIARTEVETKGGVLLTQGSQMKPTSGDIEAISDDVHGVKPGQTVLYNKFGIGADDLLVQDVEYTMIRELDLIGTFPKSNASVDDIPNLEPLGDRIILKLAQAELKTKGGILLTSSAQEKPVQGTVSKVGPGLWDDEKKEIKPMSVKVGQEVVYFKYAGDQMQDGEGNKYVVLHESDVLGTMN